ncbi:MAG: DNA gyrase inhibitor YacG [Rhodoferax sp.]|nr:DNA gyrase inhibitor YacG [Rhodoferax sp.]OIP19771.1 MAG: DNA gyrase inhibitor YacG [Comamonadaceae bacterium CG2_30_60_41]PIW07380.1 MAG: DNA gyrase inhibitor YacG [Comamonadaceae bacterium CG17_big_fil_post_rev_8_21_14_2_50_60_13]PIY26351.1 MAG: DNA gyrase inhibitor YacG [Comamonadaceae bacterium CG_4_10_14_3_um_filter_60_75]PJC12574.1 MAG: DNA gyrase inhibitor YacG [Comamonadaceae bacterium CG_4_9_14_0_8_um_filter_60_18]
MKSATGTQAPRIVTCPTCGGPSVYASSNACRPFCCARCRQLDLGAWASERFVLPSATPPDPDGQTSH